MPLEPHDPREQGDAQDYDPRLGMADATGATAAPRLNEPRVVHDAPLHEDSEAADGSSRVAQAADRAKSAARRVKRGVQDGADYVRSHGAPGIWQDVQNVARRNPGASLLAVASVGFILGRTMRRAR